MVYGIKLIVLALLAADCDPRWIGLFTPSRPHLGHYETCTAGEHFREPRFTYAEPEHLEALDAFGDAGSYDRARLARLFGGRRVTVVRGWQSEGNRFESVTLLSPYPDPTLSRLQPGTLIIRWIRERP